MTREELIQCIYDAPDNRAPKAWIILVLAAIESAGLKVVDPLVLAEESEYTDE